MHEFDYEELEAATESFASSRIIGKGSHGCIYKGTLKDGTLVAIKKQSLGLQKLQDNSKLDNEIRILSLSTKNDVFSFGVVLLELISATKAIDVSRDPSSIVEWALPLIEEDRVEEICDERVTLPAYMASRVRHMLRIAARCVSSDEDHRRPSMVEVVDEMENCFVERVRFSLWVDILDACLKRRPQRAVAKRKGDVVIATAAAATVTTGHGKMLLREVLADIALE
ncbi:hypothetical protein C3L33_21245, partial [Rhododendron williamsianum]